MTTGPTKAMLAAAQGQPFHIPFGGRVGFQYTDDAANAFILAARAPFEGADVFSLRGSVVPMQEVVGAIEAAEPSARGQITFDDKTLGLPEELDDSALVAAVGKQPFTPLKEAVAATIETFKQAIARGQLANVS